MCTCLDAWYGCNSFKKSSLHIFLVGLCFLLLLCCCLIITNQGFNLMLKQCLAFCCVVCNHLFCKQVQKANYTLHCSQYLFNIAHCTHLMCLNMYYLSIRLLVSDRAWLNVRRKLAHISPGPCQLFSKYLVSIGWSAAWLSLKSAIHSWKLWG